MDTRVTVTVDLLVPQELIDDLRDNWGVGLLGWTHEQFEIMLAWKAKQETQPTCRVMGMSVRGMSRKEIFATGTCYKLSRR